MIRDFLSVYATLHLFFFSLALYILHKFSMDVATQLEYKSFRFFICTYLVYVPASVTATFISYDVAPLPRWIIDPVWNIDIFSIVLIGLSLYMFTVFRHASHISRWKWFTFLSSIPVSIILIFMLVSLKNGIVFSVAKDNRIIYGPVYPALPILSTVYFVAILLFAMAKYHLSRSYVKRRQLATLSCSVLFVFLSVLVDEHFRKSYLTVLPAATLCAIVYLYVNMQEGSIYTDALTGMNNRRKAKEYLSMCLDSLSEENPLYLYMCDVNSFKKINDGFGHAEGDHALILTAEALKTAIAKRDGFAARFGGDEFLLAWFPGSGSGAQESAEALIADIQLALAKACAEQGKPYPLTVSIGYARCADPGKSFTDYIKMADEMLYARKRAFHENERKA